MSSYRRTTLSLAALLVSACSTDLPTGPAVPAGPPLASAAASSPAAARYEVRFMENMIDHHMMAVMTAEMCIEKAVHPELRALCESIVTTQMAEIETMQTWLSAWYGISYEPMMTPGMQAEVDRLAALSGAEFEEAFMEMMIRHHQRAVRDAEKCVLRAEHEALASTCQGIVGTQLLEIVLMETWLCEWYGDCK